MKKKIKIALTDFALPAPRQGSIDVNSGFADSKILGIDIHQLQQQIKTAQDANYSAEVKVSHTFETNKYCFEVNGRIDGIYNRQPMMIEEIKTAFNLTDLLKHLQANPDTHPYCLQLKTYGYIHWLKTNKLPALNFI